MKIKEHSFVHALASAAALLLSITSPGALAAEHGGGSHHEHAPLHGVQSLDIATEGNRIHLLLGEYRSGQTTPVLLYQCSEDAGGTWSQPVRVDAGLAPAHAARRGMDAQIAAIGDRLVAVWMTRGTGMFDSGPMVTACSDDGGKTWRGGPNPADDASTEGHGFIDIAADAGGVFHLTWLDDRNGQRGLRYARSTDVGKSWSANTTVDAETCECCWNTVAVGADGTVGILYRDKAPRDMSVASLSGDRQKWRTNRAGGFGWDFNGCPHVGGGIAISGNASTQVFHAAVWTGHEAKTGAYYLQTTDGGETWSAPHPLALNGASHPDIASDGAQRLVVAWDQGGAGIMTDESRDGGKTWSGSRPLEESGRTASHPRVAFTGGVAHIFWTETDNGGMGRWRSTALERKK